MSTTEMERHAPPQEHKPDRRARMREWMDKNLTGRKGFFTSLAVFGGLVILFWIIDTSVGGWSSWEFVTAVAYIIAGCCLLYIGAATYDQDKHNYTMSKTITAWFLIIACSAWIIFKPDPANEQEPRTVATTAPAVMEEPVAEDEQTIWETRTPPEMVTIQMRELGERSQNRQSDANNAVFARIPSQNGNPMVVKKALFVPKQPLQRDITFRDLEEGDEIDILHILVENEPKRRIYIWVHSDPEAFPDTER